MLTLQNATSGVERLSQSMFNAQIDLNPHQVEAALFAFNSPLSNGIIIADEVGLGKTIEAGLVMCQYWSERKRNIIIVCPASLRKQWSMELKEKFFIDSIILEAKTFNDEIKRGNLNPFHQENKIVITSYNFVARREEYILQTRFNLAVIDEAHKLRNVYKPNNKNAKKIKMALSNTKKLLLTATPLQNSLLELFGLVSVIDEQVFGDQKSFKLNYSNRQESSQNDLIERLKPILHRTLRKDVLEYIKYTNRIPVVQEFYPSEDEQTLYELISDFLQSDKLYAIPSGQRTLITLIMRKLLASSPRAIAGTLQTMSERLQHMIDQNQPSSLSDTFDDDAELIEDYEDELEEEIEQLSEQNIKEIKGEIDELRAFKSLAASIDLDAKTLSLLTALEQGFEKQDELGAKQKALIFTESKRTQEYLKEYLEDNGFKNKVVLFNGTNTDKRSKEIYDAWILKHQGSDRITGSKTADRKQAIVDFFREEATIMIATEAGSEGINLQFCNLLVNYDLPWNPQRVEQRIGRCHRYGQKHDVVVVNFINKRNEADQRVYQLLSEKFKLFEGIFGASDEVLGAIESGVDFEKRILEIYQTCRDSDAIEDAFNKIQEELNEQIEETMLNTRRQLLEHFDSDVHSRLKMHLDESKRQMDRVESAFWTITKFELESQAEFDDDNALFNLHVSPFSAVDTGTYQLITQKNRVDNAHTYRINSKLGEAVIYQAKARELPEQKLTFELSNHRAKIALLEPHKGKQGVLSVLKLKIESFETEEYLIANAVTDEGTPVDSETMLRLFELNSVTEGTAIDSALKSQVDAQQETLIANIRQNSEERNGEFFNQEIEKLDKWADDQLLEREKELKELRKEITSKRTLSRTAPTQQKLKIQMEIRNLEKRQSKLKHEMEEAEDIILEKRSTIIDHLAETLNSGEEVDNLFTIAWRII